MPRNRRRVKKRRGGRPGNFERGPSTALQFSNDSSSFVRQTFTFHTRFVGSGTVAQVRFDPLNSPTFFGPEVFNMASQFQEFRCVGLKVVVLPSQETPSGSGNTDTGQAIGWRPEPPFFAPTTVDHIMASTKSIYVNDSLSVPSVFTLSRSEIRKNMLTKWLHVGAGASSELDDHGSLFYASIGTNAGTAVWTWIVQSIWEFQTPTALGQQLSKLRGIDEKSPVREHGLSMPPGVRCSDLGDGKEDVKVQVEQVAPSLSTLDPCYECPSCSHYREMVQSMGVKGPPLGAVLSAAPGRVGPLVPPAIC